MTGEEAGAKSSEKEVPVEYGRTQPFLEAECRKDCWGIHFQRGRHCKTVCYHNRAARRDLFPCDNVFGCKEHGRKFSLDICGSACFVAHKPDFCGNGAGQEKIWYKHKFKPRF